MLRKLLITLVLIGPACALADSKLTIPWDEFRSLYSERLRHEFEQELEDDTPEAVVTIAEATYKVALSGPDAIVEIGLRGSVIQGRPDPIPLFEHDLAVTEVLTMQGGTLISDAEGYRFFIKGEGDFELSLKAALAVGEDQRSQLVTFAIPSAVQNRLEVEMTGALEIIDAPGIKQPDGRYYFSPESVMELRFADTSRLEATREPSIDTFTRITLEGGKYVLATTFAPNQRVPEEIEISFAASLRYLDSSLRRSFIKPIDRQRLAVALARDWRSPFELRFELDALTDGQSLTLPAVVGNQGREGEFQIFQPVEARIGVDGDGLQRRIPAARLSEPIQASAGVGDAYLSIPIASAIALSIERFDEVKAPDVVLDAIHFYTSFAENGTAISVLRLDLPATTGNRLQLKSIPDAEIWSLIVNGKEQSLYTHQQGSWIVPLPEHESAVVELTYVQKHEKLGLEGQLRMNLPAIGLAAQHVFVGIALAERVKLIALESDLTPSDGTYWPRVKSFVGTPYYFEYPFYRGESLVASIYYKEPLSDARGETS